MSGLSARQTSELFLAACRAELQALKPGNVHVHAGGHGMGVDQFEASAVAAAPFLVATGEKVGVRILRAVEVRISAHPIGGAGAVIFCLVFVAAPDALGGRLYTRPAEVGRGTPFCGYLDHIRTHVVARRNLRRLGRTGGLAVLLWRQGSLKRLGLVVATVAVAGGCAVGIIALSARAGQAEPAAVHNYVAQTTHLTSNAGSADTQLRR